MVVSTGEHVCVVRIDPFCLSNGEGLGPINGGLPNWDAFVLPKRRGRHFEGQTLLPESEYERVSNLPGE